MPAKFIKAFDIGNKNDPADARTIWMVTDAEQAVTVKTRASERSLPCIVRANRCACGLPNREDAGLCCKWIVGEQTWAGIAGTA